MLGLAALWAGVVGETEGHTMSRWGNRHPFRQEATRPPAVFALLAELCAERTGDADGILRAAAAAVRESFGFERAFAYRLSDEGDVLLPVGEPDAPETEAPCGRPVDLESGEIFVRARSTRAAVVAETGLGELVAIPVVAGPRWFGFVAADAGGKVPALRDDDLRLLSEVGAVAGVLLRGALEQENARRTSELKSHFIALASHELRAPFAVMHGIVKTLRHRAVELPERQLRGLRDALYDQSERMSRLIEQLLDVSRLDADAIPIERVRFAIRPRLEAVVDTVVGERSRDVTIDAPPDLEVEADPKAFDGIVSNLVVNAFRHGRAPITISARQRDHHFRLAVEDRGSGVAREFVPRLFEPFAQSEPAEESGSGLGLSIAQSYAQAHGGELVYTSVYPHGARFELVLPRPHAPEPRAD